jgi:hypothetical protein
MGRPIFHPWVVMLNAAKDYDDTSESIPVNSSYAQSVQVHWGAGATDGEVVVECADSKTFSGTWAELKRMPCTGSNRLDLYEHDGPCVFIRTRITKAVAGGTVTTKLQAMVG